MKMQQFIKYKAGGIPYRYPPASWGIDDYLDLEFTDTV